MDQDQQQAMHILATVMPIVGLFILVIVGFLVFLFWRIFAKAGLSGPLSLLILVPGIGQLIVLCILAFADWNVVPAPKASPHYPPTYPPPPVPPAYPPPPPPQA